MRRDKGISPGITVSLTAMAAVEIIAGGVKEKESIGSVNTEGEYLESR